MNKFKVSTFFDSRYRPESKEGRVMMNVTINRKIFCISLKLFCTRYDYDKILGGRMLNDVQKKLKNDIYLYLIKAETLLSKLNDPTQETFLKFFKSDMNLNTGGVEVYSLFQMKISVLNREERFGTALNYELALRSLKLFRKELYFEDIDEKFLKDYKNFMIKRKRSLTTTGMYLRDLRQIYNEAISDGLISGNLKPFKNIQLSSNVKSKSVLYPSQLKMLWEYKAESIRAQRGIAFFFFSYLCNGMNFKDICCLKWKNINNDILTFVREKTKNTKHNETEIKVYLCDEAKKIIAVWGNKNKNPDDYIFQLMPSYHSAKHFNDTIIRYARTSNKQLALIGKELGFDVHLCLGLARHSFATSQKIHAVSTAIISEQLGHSSVLTTMHYLKSLPDSMLKDVNKHLLDF